VTAALRVATLLAVAVLSGPGAGAAAATEAGSSPASSSPASSSPAAGTSGPATSASATDIPFVPVVGFWSDERTISLGEIRDAFAGSSKRFTRVLVPEPSLEPLAASLGVEPGRTTTTATASDISREVDRNQRTLALMPATQVWPGVRALAVDDSSLFGAGRVRTLDEWPLTVPSTGAPDGSSEADAGPLPAFDPEAVWTLAAAGDVNLDREIYRQTVRLDKGPDFPWDGGHGKIASRRCCNEFGGPEITARRAGGAGAVRALFEGADLAIVNHEGPAPDDFRWNPHGLRFSFDPALEVGLQRAGIDLVSLANNHIRDAGSEGVLDSIANVRDAGMEAVGAGGDARTAGEPVCRDLAGQRVCFLAYNDVDPADDGTASRPGAAPLRISAVRRDIRRARREGADVVVVVPHWGIEYTPSRTQDQRRKATAMVKAGADLILGAHSHVVGAMESIDRVPVLYSMGNFIFDLTRFEQTLEGVIVVATFQGDRLLQLDLRPTVLIDLTQPNLLDPERDGRVVLQRMRKASKGLYP
jgi:poly-gamma-glutamate synthesis protein (capsule biosynthesis protein)